MKNLLSYLIFKSIRSEDVEFESQTSTNAINHRSAVSYQEVISRVGKGMNSALDHVPVPGLVPGEATDSHHTANILHLPSREVSVPCREWAGGNMAKPPHPKFSGVQKHRFTLNRPKAFTGEV